MTVLILARRLDTHVDRVIEELTSRGVPVFRTDLAEFPQSLILDARLGPKGWDGDLDTRYRSVRLTEIRSVWYRHPTHFEFPEQLSRAERRHAATEARCAFGGALTRLNALWVNYPSREADAVKPAQLPVAQACGLQVPPSLLTNKPAAVREFAKEVGGPLAVKPSGEWIMFECNPFGAYGWIEDELNFPITIALADLLADGAVRS